MANFSSVPVIRAARSKFDLSYDHKMSANVGTLYPCYIQEIYPGDSFNCSATVVTRLSSTFLRPVMDNLFLDMYFFFVPARLCYDKWAQIFGENRDGAWSQQTPVAAPVYDYDYPQYKIVSKSVGDYLGLPVGFVPVGINVLPFRAFALIYDEWFRDENNIPPMRIQKGAFVASGSSGGTAEAVNGNVWSPSNYTGMCPKVAKFHDYFTSCLPAPQKGDSVSVPLGSFAPIVPRGSGTTDQHTTDWSSKQRLTFLTSPNSNTYGLGLFSNGTTGYKTVKASTGNTGTASTDIIGSNLWADLKQVEGALNVNDLRYAFQIQKILERSARSGSRYTEYLLSAFGVQSPDARLQRPEYLGGKRMPLSIQQVAQTAPASGDDSDLGSLGAFSLSNGQCGYTKGFVEHGYVIGVCAIRQHHTYQQGVERFWTRHNRFDFYDPTLANIGEQPVYKSELYVTPNDDNNQLNQQVFGYNEAWADLRFRPSSVAGDMRSASSTSLDIWHFADNYANAPVLSSQFINETSDFVDRTIAVPSSSMDQFIMDIYFKQSAVRRLPTFSVPSLIDHN